MTNLTEILRNNLDKGLPGTLVMKEYTTLAHRYVDKHKEEFLSSYYNKGMLHFDNKFYSVLDKHMDLKYKR